MKRILITGASGFIGKQVVRELRSTGVEIHTVQHSARLMSDSRNHTVDLLNADQTTRLMERVKPTHLVHLAWYTEHGKYWTSPLNLDWVAASMRLFKAFADYGGKRAVFAGTCAEYDWTAPSPLNEENSPSNPGTLYGACKNSLRQIVEKYAALSEISVAWGRIFFLYGPDEHPMRLVPSIVQPLLRNETAVVRSGGHVRNIMHVRDVARAFIHILNSSATGIVNIASNEAVTLGEIATLAGAIAGYPDLVKIEQAAGTPQNPLLLTADTQKLCSLGFHAHCTLQDGLAGLIENSQ